MRGSAGRSFSRAERIKPPVTLHAENDRRSAITLWSIAASSRRLSAKSGFPEIAFPDFLTDDFGILLLATWLFPLLHDGQEGTRRKFRGDISVFSLYRVKMGYPFAETKFPLPSRIRMSAGINLQILSGEENQHFGFDTHSPVYKVIRLVFNIMSGFGPPAARVLPNLQSRPHG